MFADGGRHPVESQRRTLSAADANLRTGPRAGRILQSMRAKMAGLARPFGARIVVAWTLATVLALYGVFDVWVDFFSDPCIGPRDRASCERDAIAWMWWNASISLILAVAMTVAAVHRTRLRNRLAFLAPPGWPAAPPGWIPPVSWRPDPHWPSPPDGWSYWRPSED